MPTRETDSYDVAAEAICDLAVDGEVHVVSPMFPAQPDVLLAALVGESGRRSVRLVLYAADLSGHYSFLAGDRVPEHVTVVTIGGRVPGRFAGQLDFMPTTLFEIARAFEDGLVRVDAFVSQVGVPDSGGRSSWGPVVAYSPAAMAAARASVLEINHGMPVIPGHPGIDVDAVDLLLDTGASHVGELVPRPPSQIHRRIGAHLASLIPDGATLQFGIGGVPEGFLPHLHNHRGLRIHSGAIPESAIDLIASGAVASGRHLTTSLLGTSRLYAWAADPASGVRVEPVGLTHAPSALAALQSFYSVNSAFQVDLTGQVNAETVDGIKRSSAGGQADFGRWAHQTTRGNIIALASHGPDGRPNIVDQLSSPTSVTTHRSDLDFVVTEQGVADLRGRTQRARAQALLAISGR